MYIRDPLFGNIKLGDLEGSIIECSDFQRLRYIRQLGFAFLVYPGAVYSRFEHSLGTFHVTRDLAANVSEEDNEELALAGLLHDLGHGPFSHSSDPLIAEFLGTNHELAGMEKVRRGEIGDIIRGNGLSVEKLTGYLRGESLGGIVGGVLGSDRIDYLMRDALHIGVAYGVIDYNRIKGKLTLYNGRPAIYASGMQGAESLLISRYFMHMSVYFHHAGDIATEMYRKAARIALQNGAFDPKELLEMTDDEVIIKISSEKEAGKLLHKVFRRKLFKRVYYGGARPGIGERELEDAMASAGIPQNEYIINTQKSKEDHEEGLSVVSKDGSYMGRLEELSPLVKALINISNSRNILMVAVEKDRLPAAAKAMENVLN